jgi:hypothetical protein
MLERLMNIYDRLRRLVKNYARRALILLNWYRESSCTEAERRGVRLLKEWLSPEQLAQFETRRYFDVVGRHSGKRYRIRYGTATNIHQLNRAGHPEAGWCFVPGESLVAGDVMLAQKIALETDEASALAVARRFTPVWH